ncbi:nuclear transport factor 2 family protein [Saccharospirillum impatiens]|uniref:nuclear transport factor 2 family protein n=1 Tax=Saccharospirillum impatiens TaxID=169438 RepID=UPI00040308FF|nr:nuclear transport factor 2 family protein [Saccharospirillum impatiens]
MPMLQVNLLNGYSPDIKHRLMRALTCVVRGITQARPDAITVWIHEVGSDQYSRGGEPRQPGVGAPDAAAVVSDYLAAMEARDLQKAETFLAADFVMSFPGSGELTSLAQLVDWARGRYRYVQKTIAATDVAYGMDTTVVTTHGTLAGQWPDGVAFSDVRFIDRFELQAGLLVRQDVWNDLANARE